MESYAHRIGRGGVIDQAKGALMALGKLDEQEAFDLLRTRARAERRRVQDVAEDVMAGRLAALDLLAD